MDEDLRSLEEVLRAKAAEVPSLQTAPATLRGRARRRVARNALASVVAVVLVAFGASAALAALGVVGGRDRAIPGSSVPPTAPPSVVSCAATDLRASAALDGAAGSVVGAIEVTNVGATTCTLEGRPGVTLSTQDHVLVLSPSVIDVAPQWQVDGVAAPEGWPLVRLDPGAKASIRVRWSNACPQLSSAPVWHLDLGDGGGLDVSGATAIASCSGSAEPSTLEVGPFEPSAG